MKVIVSNSTEKVQFKGKLKKTKDNFVYLDISNNFINALYSALDEENAEKPPYDSKEKDQGAHVSVIKSDEYDEKGIEKINEIGEEFSFTLKGCKSVNPAGWKEMKKVYFLEVQSEELEKLRKKYGLSKKVDGHEFHITFGVEKY